MVTLAINPAVDTPKKASGMLPVLIVLFLISYALLSILVVEQGRTIESQRELIHNLFIDSAQLNALKMKEVLRERAATSPMAKNGPRVAAPQSQLPNRTGKNAGRSQHPVLQRPPKAAADQADARRIPLTV